MAKYVRKTLADKNQNFINKATAKHGSLYKYSKVDYKSSQERVVIGCAIHGDFTMTPTCHLSGAGCRKCSDERWAASAKGNTEDFVARATQLHDHFYDYSKVVYELSNKKVEIICPTHGVFLQSPNTHLQGHGCPKCSHQRNSDKLSLTYEAFLLRATKAHGITYDYSLVQITDAKTNIQIVCKTHGSFWQKPHHHMNGHGCATCASVAAGEMYRKTNDEYIEDAIAEHGYKYDYSLVEYKGASCSVKILCKEHGVFEQNSQSHLSGRGCPKCNRQGGFNQMLPASIYILRSGDMIKVGITNKNAEYRAKHVGDSFGAEFTVVEEYDNLRGITALNTETAVLRKLRGLYESPSSKFDGSTECFFDVPLDWLKDLVAQEMDNYEKEGRLRPQ